MTFTSGQIIEFISKESGLSLGIVLSVSSKGIRVLMLNRKETTITDRNVMHIGEILKYSPSDMESLVQRASEIETRRQNLVSSVDLENLHSLLAEDIRSYTIEEIAGYVTDNPAGDLGAALVRRLSEDKLYFRNRKEGFQPLSLAEVQEAKLRENKKMEQAKEEEELIAGLKKLALNHAEPPSEKLKPVIEHLLKILLHGENAQVPRKIFDLHLKAGFSSEKKLFNYLVQIGRIGQDENIPLLRNNFPVKFSEAAIKEAAALANIRISPENRKDLRNLKCWVIDNESTRDRDDGFSIGKNDDGSFDLWIHIADVANFIPLGSELEREASLRGTTVYLPDGNFPMFPESLSENFLSLNQDCERLTLSQKLTFSGSGEVLGNEFFEAISRITNATNYSQADREIASEPDLALAVELAGILENQRKKSGAVIIPQRPELKLVLNDGTVSIKELSRNSPTQLMVAEFMIWSNHLAAAWLRDHQIPCLYRVQEGPAETVEFSEEFDPVLFFKLIRLLKKTSISARPGLHGCLGVNPYTQITSPIRRFGDLILQHQIKAALSGKQPPFGEGELRDKSLLSESSLENADSIMFQRNKYFLIKYLKQEVNAGRPTLSGKIVDAGMSEVQVYLDDLFEFGHCRKPSFDVRVGQPVKLKITSLDPFDLTFRFEVESAG